MFLDFFIVGIYFKDTSSKQAGDLAILCIDQYSYLCIGFGCSKTRKFRYCQYNLLFSFLDRACLSKILNRGAIPN